MDWFMAAIWSGLYFNADLYGQWLKSLVMIDPRVVIYIK